MRCQKVQNSPLGETFLKMKNICKAIAFSLLFSLLTPAAAIAVFAIYDNIQKIMAPKSIKSSTKRLPGLL